MPAEPQHSSGLGDLLAATGPGSPRAAGAAARGRPGRARGGRRRGRRRHRRAGAAGPRGRARRGSPRRRAPSPRTRVARSAYAGSSASRSAYSFMVEPQPAALTTMCSTPARLEGVDRACGRTSAPPPRGRCAPTARRSSPARRARRRRSPRPAAPGRWRSSRRGKNAPCTQPVSRPTTARRGPAAWMYGGSGSRLAEAGREALHRGQLRGHPLEQAGAPHQPGRARCAWQAAAARAAAAAAWGAGTARRSAPRSALSLARALVVALDLRAGLPR